MLFPSISDTDEITRITLTRPTIGDDLPDVLGVFALSSADGMDDLPKQSPRPTPLLVEHSEDVFLRPGIRGQRVSVDSLGSLLAGTAWSPRFVVSNTFGDEDHLTIDAKDDDAQLALRTELETLKGGTLRVRHTLTNTGDSEYLLDALNVHVPLSDDLTEIMDFTGRHEHERDPQRRAIADGTWLRECRYGRPGFEGQIMVAGTPGFDFGHGRVMLVQLAWSGNSTLEVDRNSSDEAGINAGELLSPSEVTLGKDESYSTPWVMITASNAGLDGISASLHTWQRSLPEHPAKQPVILNVWEGVMFDHNLDRLLEIARRAARIGVERYVLDDGWFHLRRDDHAGLGDWWVDPDVWPEGLTPLVDAVHKLGMEFGLWFEPEMVNPDSDFYREHPDWVLQASNRVPILQRNQLVADLSNPAVFDHIHDAMFKVLSAYDIDYVKWDHNRNLLEAGSQVRGGAPAVHQQTLAYYRLSTRCVPNSLTSHGNLALPEEAASIWALWRGYVASGIPMTPTPSHVSLSSVGPCRPWRLNCSVRISRSPALSRPAVPIPSRSALPQRSSTASALNGTSPRPVSPILTNWLHGWLGTRRIATSCIPDVLCVWMWLIRPYWPTVSSRMINPMRLSRMCRWVNPSRIVVCGYVFRDLTPLLVTSFRGPVRNPFRRLLNP